MKNKWYVLIALSLMAALIDLDLLIVNLAISTIADHFSAGLTAIHWIGSIYTLSALLVLIAGGVIADRYLGKKKIYLSGILFFLVGSVFAAYAPTIVWLNIGRSIQGIGFGLTISLGATILSQVFPKEKLGLIIGIYMTVMGISQALGPSIGGIILNHLSWEWIFLINLPLGLCSLILLLLFYKEPELDKTKQGFDGLGLLFLALSTILFFIGLHAIQIETSSIFSISFWLVGAILSSIIFVMIEKRKEYPLVDTKLFSIHAYKNIIIIRAVNLAVWGGILLIIPLYFQNILGFSSSQTGLLLFMITCMFAISSPLIGKLSQKIGFELPTQFSVIIMILALGILLFVKEIPLPLVLFSLSLIGLSSGIVATTSIGIVCNTTPSQKSGQSMSILYTFMLLGFSLGIAFSSLIMKIVGQSYLFKGLQKEGILLSSKDLNLVTKMASGIVSLKNYDPTNQKVLFLCKNSFYYGFNSMIVAYIICVACTLILSQKLSHSNRLSHEVSTLS